MLSGKLQTAFGWRVHVGAETTPTSLRNFPMQAHGSEMMRLAACLATERGIGVCCPVHDAFLIEAEEDKVEADTVRMQDAMREASEVILPGFPLRTDAKIVRHPDRYSDARGRAMWETVMGILERIEQVGVPPVTNRCAVGGSPAQSTCLMSTALSLSKERWGSEGERGTRSIRPCFAVTRGRSFSAPYFGVETEAEVATREMACRTDFDGLDLQARTCRSWSRSSPARSLSRDAAADGGGVRGAALAGGMDGLRLRRTEELNSNTDVSEPSAGELFEHHVASLASREQRNEEERRVGWFRIRRLASRDPFRKSRSQAE
jgi:hypothetical protein